MKAKTKKHGVYITEHNSRPWNTKTVYSHGQVCCVYRRVPKRIRFKSPMVNDKNQDLCGGWFMGERDMAAVEIETIKRLCDGKKPFGALMGILPEQADIAEELLEDAGLVVQRKPHFWEGRVSVFAAWPMRLKEIGDLNLLIADYRNAGIVDLYPEGLFEKEVKEFGERQLSSFFDKWDIPDVPAWVTGLILGYPIENTISLYLRS